MDARVADAVRALSAGELVVYPTDTVYGLGARADHREAVRRLLLAKRRPEGQPLSVAVSSLEEIEPLARLSRGARRFVRRHLPGPYTVLLRPSPLARRKLVPEVTGGARIGIRVPDHPVAREIARRVGPIIATSANHHHESPSRTARGARQQFGPAVAVYVDARPRPKGTPSLVIDLAGSVPRTVPRR
jgi:L-threonylcarbamoyladenylate synthase